MEVGEEMSRALGAGFDLTSDFRLRFAKLRRRLVDLDEERARDVPVPGGTGAVLRGVPRDVAIDKGDRIRFRSDLLDFNQVHASSPLLPRLFFSVPAPCLFGWFGDWASWPAPCIFVSLRFSCPGSWGSPLSQMLAKIGGYQSCQI